MKIGHKTVRIFKMENRRGYAALCGHCLTEGKSQREAYDRMVKALKRVARKLKRK